MALSYKQTKNNILNNSSMILAFFFLNSSFEKWRQLWGENYVNSIFFTEKIKKKVKT